MAKANRICSVENCDKPARARGWCSNHYWRWQKHGDPLGGGTANGEPLRYFREAVLTYDGDECLVWPYAKVGRGYGQMWHNGRLHLVSRLVCEEKYGPPPTPNHEAAHSCGRGHLACVTKGHLSWKTSEENKADKLVHGTHNRGERHGLAKLTEAQAQAIIALKGEKSQQEIAEMFGVCRENVGNIQRGKRWKWLN